MTPIDEKYQQLGGANSFLGVQTKPETPTPGGQGSYAEYQHGMIFYNPSYGAVAITAEIEAKWKSNSVSGANTGDGINIRTFLGFPTTDSSPISHGRGQVCYFERGMIVVNVHNAGSVTYGNIYIQYRSLGDVDGWVGLPLSDESAASGGGRVSLFEQADIYWSAATGAHEVHGAIRDRYRLLNGPAGLLGYPLSDESPVYNGATEVGRYNEFQNGTIYWSGGTGAWEVHGDLRRAWQTQYGGPVGQLGFPTSNETSSASDNYRFNNFQHGVLAWSNSTGEVRKITRLDFVVNSFEGKGGDAWGDVDVYVKTTIVGSTGFRYTGRYPSSGDMGSSHNFNGSTGLFCTIPVTDGNMSVKVDMEGWDADDTSADDLLGTLSATYTIDNLWDATTSNPKAQDWNSDFKTTFNFKPDGLYIDAFNEATFRKNLFWSFNNTPISAAIGSLTHEIFASTFSDVGQDEHWYSHPFNALFYEVYSRVISPSKGVCFGMVLEAIYALKGASSSNEYISQYPIDDVRKKAIAIKHGYQLGGQMIDFFLARFILGDTHNPVKAFIDSRDAFARGDIPVISVTPGAGFAGGGHAVLPYHWDTTTDPNAWVMKVANPNHPYTSGDDDSGDDNVIIINPASNSFSFAFDGDHTWRGDSSSGGRLYAVPYHIMCEMPRTPFWEVFALIAAGTLLIMGDGGAVQQVTDGNGRTLYKPDASLNEDRSTRIPGIVEVSPVAGPITPTEMAISRVATSLPQSKPAMHYFKSSAFYDKMYADKLVEVKPVSLANNGSLSSSHLAVVAASAALGKGAAAAGAAATPSASVLAHGAVTTSLIESIKANSLVLDVLNTGDKNYEWGISSGVIKMHVNAPSAKGTLDTIAVDGIGSSGQALTFQLRDTCAAKKVKITIGGLNDDGIKRMFQMSNTALVAGQSVTVQVSNGCKELLIHNTGPELTFDLNLYSSTYTNPLSSKTSVKIDANTMASIAPAEWQDSKLATSPVNVSIFDKLGGTVQRQFTL